MLLTSGLGSLQLLFGDQWKLLQFWVAVIVVAVVVTVVVATVVVVVTSMATPVMSVASIWASVIELRLLGEKMFIIRIK